VFKNADALHEEVATAMQPPLATIDASASVDEIVNALTSGTNAVLVATEGRPVGVVTRSDLLEYLARRPH
jgi:cystathionine beta-synthase